MQATPLGPAPLEPPPALDTRALGPDGDPAVPRYASWGRRVLATILDIALIEGALFVAFPVHPVGSPLGLRWPDAQEILPAAWWYQSWGVVALVAAMVLMQAYLGATPGKLVMSIAVVRTRTHRPAGLLLVLAREVLHVVDAFLLFVGYLRPLWHRQRRTFADSLAGTDVLHTDRPLLHPWLERLRARHVTAVPAPTTTTAWAGSPWQQPSRPRWLRATSSAATALVAIGATFALWPSTYSATSAQMTCGVTGEQVGAVNLWGGDLAVHPTPATVTRLGLTREVRSDEPEGVVVQWHLDGDHPQTGTLRLVLSDANGNLRQVIDHQVRDWEVQRGRGEPEGQYGVRLPVSVLDRYEPGWVWSVSVVDAAGVESAACTGVDPTG